MELAKKIFRFLSSILFYSVVLILGIAFLMYLASFVDKKISMKNGEYRSPLFGAYIIISESMVPQINVYDAVVTIRVDAEDIEVDDIITFISKEIETAGTPITHRVIGIVYEDDTKEKIIGFRTKGDHNNTADFALIAPDEVIGKVFLRIPMIGYLQTIMTKPIGWLLIVVVPCLLIIGSDIFKLIKSSKQKEEDTASEGVVLSDKMETLSEANSIGQTNSVNIHDFEQKNTESIHNASGSGMKDLNQSPNADNLKSEVEPISTVTIVDHERAKQSSSDTNSNSDKDTII